MKIREFIADFAIKNNLVFINDTSAGLNIDRDDPADSETPNDKDCIFLNVVETGSMTMREFNRKFEVIRNIEVGLLKRCHKEADGIEYQADFEKLFEVVKKLYLSLNKEFDIQSATFDNAVDSLDSNNVVYKLNFSISEVENVC